MDIKKIFKEKIIEIINLIITLVLFIIVIIKLPSPNKGKLSSSDIKELANDLKSKGLYQQAIEVYKEFLKNSSVSKRIRSNINYMIANIYEEYLKDFDNALLYYYKSKLIYPSTPLLNNINQKIVKCLENSGRSREAQLALEESTLLNNKDNKKKETSVIVAKIDNDIITLDDFNRWYEGLPDEIKAKYNSREKKKELLHQFIGQELMYRMALRKGYQNNPDILKKAFEIKKNLMIQKLMQDELLNKIKISKNDIELYYKANKNKYKAPLSRVYKEVYNDLMQEKISEESQQLLQRMINANKVVIFDGNIK